jgi:hypothetical protein
LGATAPEAKLPNIMNIDEKVLLNNIKTSYNNRKNAIKLIKNKLFYYKFIIK